MEELYNLSKKFCLETMPVTENNMETLSIGEMYTKILSGEYYSWKDIPHRYSLSEEFIREFEDKIDWQEVSTHQVMSIEFIKEFADRLDWYCFCRYQSHSDMLLETFSNKLNWHAVSKYQMNLSEDFIRKFANKLNWYFIFKHFKQSLSLSCKIRYYLLYLKDKLKVKIMMED